MDVTQARIKEKDQDHTETIGVAVKYGILNFGRNGVDSDLLFTDVCTLKFSNEFIYNEIYSIRPGYFHVFM